jgi:hypothetical protein
MSKHLKIFDYLRDYLLAANNECPSDEFVNCRNNKSANLEVFFLNKHSSTENTSTRSLPQETITWGFQQAVRAFAHNLRNYDKPTTAGTVFEAIKAELNKWLSGGTDFKTANNLLEPNVLTIVDTTNEALSTLLLKKFDELGKTILSAARTSSSVGPTEMKVFFADVDSNSKTLDDLRLSLETLYKANNSSSKELAAAVVTAVTTEAVGMGSAPTSKSSEDVLRRENLFQAAVLEKDDFKVKLSKPDIVATTLLAGHLGSLEPGLKSTLASNLILLLKAFTCQINMKMSNEQIRDAVVGKIEGISSGLGKELFAWKSANFKSEFINGSNQLVGDLLKDLAGKDVDSRELSLFNRYFRVFMGEETVLNPMKFSSIDLRNLSNYRININKYSPDITGPSPKSVSSIIGMKTSNPDIFELLPTGFTSYKNQDNSSGTQVSNYLVIEAVKYYNGEKFDLSGLSVEMTDINPQNFLLKRLRQINDETGPTSLEYQENPTINMELAGWKRIGKGKFIHETSEGKPVEFDLDSDTIQNYLKEDNKCFTFQVGDQSNPTRCVEYMKAVVDNNDPAKILEFINDSKFTWSTQAKEIANIYPELALRTLKTLGFKQKWVDNMWVIPDISVWLEKYARGSKVLGGKDNATTDKNMSAFNAKEDLIQYLKLLIQYVNTNSSILNKGKGVDKNSNAANLSKQPEEFANFRRAQNKTKSTNTIMSLQKVLQFNQKTFGNFYRGFDPVKGPPAEFGGDVTPNGVMAVLAQQKGGGSQVGGVIAFQTAIPTTLRTQNSREIYESIRKLLTKLEQKGFEMSDKEQRELMNKIDVYEKDEMYLLQTIQKIAKVNKLVDTLGLPEQEITLNELTSLSNRYDALMKKHDKSQFSWIQLKSLLQDLVEDNKNGNGVYKDLP